MKLYKKQEANTLFGYSPPVFISYYVALFFLLFFTLFCQLEMLYLSVSCHIEIIILVNASVAFCIFIGQCLLFQKTKAVFTGCSRHRRERFPGNKAGSRRRRTGGRICCPELENHSDRGGVRSAGSALDNGLAVLHGDGGHRWDRRDGIFLFFQGQGYAGCREGLCQAGTKAATVSRHLRGHPQL